MVSRRDPNGLSRGATAGCRCPNELSHGSLFRIFSRPTFFLFIALSWEFFGGFGGTNRSSFSLGLALKAPFERNKVVRLGLFWVVFGFKLMESCSSINLAQVSLSLLPLFLICSCFSFSNIVDLVHVWPKMYSFYIDFMFISRFNPY